MPGTCTRVSAPSGITHSIEFGLPVLARMEGAAEAVRMLHESAVDCPAHNAALAFVARAVEAAASDIAARFSVIAMGAEDRA